MKQEIKYHQVIARLTIVHAKNKPHLDQDPLYNLTYQILTEHSMWSHGLLNLVQQKHPFVSCLSSRTGSIESFCWTEHFPFAKRNYWWWCAPCQCWYCSPWAASLGLWCMHQCACATANKPSRFREIKWLGLINPGIIWSLLDIHICTTLCFLPQVFPVYHRTATYYFLQTFRPSHIQPALAVPDSKTILPRLL